MIKISFWYFQKRKTPSQIPSVCCQYVLYTGVLQCKEEVSVPTIRAVTCSTTQSLELALCNSGLAHIGQLLWAAAQLRGKPFNARTVPLSASLVHTDRQGGGVVTETITAISFVRKCLLLYCSLHTSHYTRVDEYTII